MRLCDVCNSNADYIVVYIHSTRQWTFCGKCVIDNLISDSKPSNDTEV